MDQNNRVFGRIGARELTPEELQRVGGGFHTELPCSFIPPHTLDGECSLP
jgi:hypothetical protein